MCGSLSSLSPSNLLGRLFPAGCWLDGGPCRALTLRDSHWRRCCVLRWRALACGGTGAATTDVRTKPGTRGAVIGGRRSGLHPGRLLVSDSTVVNEETSAENRVRRGGKPGFFFSRDSPEPVTLHLDDLASISRSTVAQFSPRGSRQESSATLPRSGPSLAGPLSGPNPLALLPHLYLVNTARGVFLTPCRGT